MKKIRVGVAGCAGRMGTMLVKELLFNEKWSDFTLTAGSIHANDTPPQGLFVTYDAEELFARADVVIDFTTPALATIHAGLAASQGKVLVVGTSGIKTEEEAALAKAAIQGGRIVYAPNMSLGVNVLFALVERAASVLNADWDAEILDLHHKHKVDAPSGTSYALAKAIKAGRRTEDVPLTLSREGLTGPRVEGSIGFSVQRGGDVIAENSVLFFGAGERVELTHRAQNRAIFAQGALTAARWAVGQKAGLYSMADVLGLHVL